MLFQVSRSDTTTSNCGTDVARACLGTGGTEKKATGCIGSPSTPHGRPHVQKRPLVVREEKSHTRRSFEFGPDPSVNQATSPVVNVVSRNSTYKNSY